MSKRYEDLTNAEKLVNTVHLPGTTGPVLERLLGAMQHQLDSLIFSAAETVNRSFQIGRSWGSDIEQIGHMLDVVRFANESDQDYRNRVVAEATAFETVTKDSILHLYEVLLGSAPTIIEPFVTKTYHSGDPVEGDEGGRFTVLFSLDMTKRSEQLRIETGGNHVVATDENIIAPNTDAVSTTTGVASETFTATLYAQNVVNFPDRGEIIIEDEWISYASKQTSPAAFINCVRGLYDSVPASHSTSTTIVEGSTKVFLHRTPNQVYSSESGTTIYVKGGPYGWDTYFDVEYKIPNEYKTEFDTPQELGAALDQLKAVGYDFKAAGINANIMVGYVFRSWFSTFREAITITDWCKLIAEDIKFPEVFDFGTPPETQVFFQSEWDTSQWDQCFWAQAYWNGSTWAYFGEKEWEYVIIRGT